MNEALKAFGSKIGGGGRYFKASDLKAEPLRVRVLPWLYKGKIIFTLPLFVGWVDVEGSENGKPVRFDVDAQIPNDLPWREGTYNGTKTVNKPKPAFAFVGYNYKSKEVQLFEVDKKDLVQPLFAWTCNDEVESFVGQEYLYNVDILLSKPSDKPIKYKIELSQNTARNPHAPPTEEMIEGLSHFGPFDFESYMKGEDPFEDGGYLFEDHILPELEKLIEGAPAKANKNTTSAKKTTSKKTEVKAESKPKLANVSEVELKNWRNVTTPKGNSLGSLSLPQLQEFKVAMENKGATGIEMYAIVSYAVEHFEDNTQESSEVASEEDEGFGF